jgi:hypothetical protein
MISPGGDRNALKQRSGVIVKIRPLVPELRQAEKQIAQMEVETRAIVTMLKQIAGGARDLFEVDMLVVRRRTVVGAARRPSARKNSLQLVRIVIRAIKAFEVEPRDADLVGLAVTRVSPARP